MFHRKMAAHRIIAENVFGQLCSLWKMLDVSFAGQKICVIPCLDLFGFDEPACDMEPDAG